MTVWQDRAGRLAVPGLRMAALAVLCLSLVAPPAGAQRGPSGQSNVIIDYSVLDELGPAPNVPQLLMPRPGAMTPPPPPGFVPSPVLRQPQASTGERIQLTPPKSVKKRPVKRTAKAPSKSSAKAKTTAKAKARPTENRTAARSETPPAPPPTPSAAPPPPPPVAEPTPTPPAPPPAPSNAARQLTPIEPPPAPPPAAPAPPAPAASPEPAPLAAPPMAPAPPAATPAAPPTPAEQPSQTAALSQPDAAGGDTTRIMFEAGSTRLEADATAALQRVAQSLAADDKLRIQLLAYAAGTAETASQARRQSLTRALAARSYLIDKGVRSTRIDVRALGIKSEGGPPDRIDVVVTRR